MSAPVSSFSKLSLSQSAMQASRDQNTARLGRKGKEAALPDNSSSSENDDESIDPEHIFALYHCRQIGDGDDDPNNRRYAFQIADATVVRYGVRVTAADTGPPRCSCGEDGVCIHVQWLLKQLRQTEVGSVGGSVPKFYGKISSVGLENVCEALQWELRAGIGEDPASEDDSDDEEEDTKWQLKKDYRSSRFSHQARESFEKRIKEVRDILATLSTDLTEDYRQDVFDNAGDIPRGEILVPEDLGATVSRLLANDEGSFFQFRSLVPRGLRAVSYFRKLNLKAKEACGLLDEYVHGNAQAGQQHDLIWCAQRLVSIVDAVSKNIISRQPLSPQARQEATKTLVNLLHEVVKNRNTDVYMDDKISRRRQHGEPQSARNLYQRLIGSTSPENPPGNAFIITTLQTLPEAQLFIEDLEEILSVLGTIGWGPAPSAFREKLAALLAHLKSDRAAVVSSTAGKRVGGASSSERKVKRMK